MLDFKYTVSLFHYIVKVQVFDMPSEKVYWEKISEILRLFCDVERFVFCLDMEIFDM